MIVASPSANINRRQVWEKTHKKEDGSISDANSSYFDQIAKLKEKITNSDEERLTVDEDILSQVMGKDTRGRSCGVGTIIPKTTVKACGIAQKKLKRVSRDNDELKMRVGSLEGTVGNLSGQMELLINMVGNLSEQGIHAPFNSSEKGTRNACKFVASQSQDTTNGANNQKCEILNSDLDIIATGTLCRDATASNGHGSPVPSTHEKVVVDYIFRLDERTNKMNTFAASFIDVGVGGYVLHPKGLIRYL